MTFQQSGKRSQKTKRKRSKALLAAGADPNAKDKYDYTVLMWAAFRNKNPEVIKALLDADANPDEKNKYGQTARDLAREKGNTAASEVLEEAQNQTKRNSGLQGS